MWAARTAHLYPSQKNVASYGSWTCCGDRHPRTLAHLLFWRQHRSGATGGRFWCRHTKGLMGMVTMSRLSRSPAGTVLRPSSRRGNLHGHLIGFPGEPAGADGDGFVGVGLFGDVRAQVHREPAAVGGWGNRLARQRWARRFRRVGPAPWLAEGLLAVAHHVGWPKHQGGILGPREVPHDQLDVLVGLAEPAGRG